jgi:HD-GYP domain-containing protein (c-di-GMP phosphodiesterase class II)
MATPAMNDARLVSTGRERSMLRLRPSERRVAAVCAIGVLTAAAAIWLLSPTPDSPWVITALLVAGYAACTRVSFEVGAGSAAPTQLAFAPMMVLLPPSLLVPAAVLGYLVGGHGRLANGKRRWETILIQIGGCWYAVGAAAVMAVAGVDHPSLAAAGWYTAAFAVQCTVDLVASVLQERLVLGASVRELVQAMAPCWMIDSLITPVSVCLAVTAPFGAVASLFPLLVLFSVFSQERYARYDQVLALNAAYRGTALLLGDVVEADHQYTGAHSRDVVRLSVGVAELLNLDPAERSVVEFAALLHDVGKIRVPKQILDKPAALTPAERQLIEQHTIWGEQMLSGVGGMLADVGRVVRSCHERWDGTGYPDRLAGTAIPVPARIVCACDAFSAMTTDRPYRRAVSAQEALDELHRCAGTQFDPQVVRALTCILEGRPPSSANARLAA